MTLRSGKGRLASESLYEFMKGQRRDGTIDHEKKSKSPTGKL